MCVSITQFHDFGLVLRYLKVHSSPDHMWQNDFIDGYFNHMTFRLFWKWEVSLSYNQITNMFTYQISSQMFSYNSITLREKSQVTMLIINCLKKVTIEIQSIYSSCVLPFLCNHFDITHSIEHDWVTKTRKSIITNFFFFLVIKHVSHSFLLSQHTATLH